MNESQPLDVVAISVLKAPFLMDGSFLGMVKLGLRDGRAVPYLFTRRTRTAVLTAIKAHCSSAMAGRFQITTNSDASKVVRAIITPIQNGN